MLVLNQFPLTLSVTYSLLISYVISIPLPDSTEKSDNAPLSLNTSLNTNLTDTPIQLNVSKSFIMTPEEEENDSSTSSTSLSPSTPLQNSVNNLFQSVTSSLRNMLQTGQLGLLRAIGTVDQTIAQVQESVQNSSFGVVLEGQKAAAKLYELTPPQVNKAIQRWGTLGDTNGLVQQLNGVVTQLRDNRKRFYDYFEEHEYDFHNVFQKVWSSVNQNLDVPELPRMQLGWH